MRDTEKKEVGMLKKVGGTKMRGMVFSLALLIGALIALPLGAAYTPPDRNQNGIPDDKDMMLGIWTPTTIPNADFDGDGVPDSLEDLNKNGVFEPNLGETDPQNIDTDADGITDGEEHMAQVGWMGVITVDPTTLPNYDADGDGVPNALDFDSDNDGLLDGQYAGVGDPYTPTPRSHFLSFNNPPGTIGGGTYSYEFGPAGPQLTNTDPYNADDDGDGISDGDEVYTYLTNPLSPDSDGDGISDFLEVTYGSNPNSTDSDGDGLTDDIEWNLAGNLTIAPDDPDGDGMYSPLDLDSDNDGLLDGQPYTTGVEDNTPGFGGVPRFLNMDSDGDGLADGTEEFVFLTDPYGYTDGDGDGLADELEFKHRLNPNTTDTDGDGIVDSTEALPGSPALVWDATWNMYISGTPTDTDGDAMPDARDLDSDNDGLFDGTYNPGWTYADGTLPNENAFGTNWRLADTDGDGLSDGWEAGNDLDLTDGSATPATFQRCDPTNPDTDGDGFLDLAELIVGANPLSLDSDGDGLPDATEGLTTDTDGDGINDIRDIDSDNDGLFDGTYDPGWTYFGNTPNESTFGTSSTNPDTDGDGLSDGFEAGNDLDLNTPGCQRTIPSNYDTDGDGINDGAELVYGTNPLNVNTDGDSFDPDGSGPLPSYPIYEGLVEDYPTWAPGGYPPPSNGTFYVEVYTHDHDGYGMEDPLDPISTDGWLDSDGDGLPDNYELTTRVLGGSETDPYNPDTDGDGLWDGDEWFPEYIDLDGILNIIDEFGIYVYSDPGLSSFPPGPGNPGYDTDGDGLNDWVEVTGDGIRDPAAPNYDVTRLSLWSYPTLLDSDGDNMPDGVSYVIKWTDVGGTHQTTTFTEDYTESEVIPDGLPNIRDTDSDNDGVPDYIEHFQSFLNPGTFPPGRNTVWAGWDPGNANTDGDSWADAGEIGGGDPGNGTINFYAPGWDADGDQLPDQFENGGAWQVYNTSVLDDDDDDDGVIDGGEPFGRYSTCCMEPQNRDTDGDGIQDGTELGFWTPQGMNTDATRYVADADHGVTQTNPINWDSDGDNLPDGWIDLDLSTTMDCGEYEDVPTVNPGDGTLWGDGAIAGDVAPQNGVWDIGETWTETGPDRSDTDGDWIKDGADGGCPPLALTPDQDGDGLKDGHELCLGTLINDADTDDDGFLDGWGDAVWTGAFGFGGNGDGLYTPGEQPGEFGEYNPITGFTGNGMVYPQGLEGLLIDTDFDIVQGGTEHGLSTVYAGGAPIVTDYFPDAIALPGCLATNVGVIVPDADGGFTTTSPLEPDEDSDNLFNGWVEDINQDGAVAATETHPKLADTDGEGVNDGYDGWETVTLDTDADGTTNALDTDSDNDGWADGVEDANGLIPVYTYAGGSDTDIDGRDDNTVGGGADNADETTYANAKDNDIDNDYLFDGIGEDWNLNSDVDVGETEPLTYDTDGDGSFDGYDGWETATIDQPDADGTTNALDGDSDADGLADGSEMGTWVTSPLLTDTDGDGRNEFLSPATNEGVNIDSDGDGIINAKDIDSDNDWLIDGAGTLFGIAYAPGTYPSTGEDNGLGLGAIANNGILENPPSGPVGIEETDPTVPEDSDGDGLPDWVELSFFGPAPGFDGVPAWLDLDYDDDGMKDAYCIGAPAPGGYDLYGPWPVPLVIGEENATVPIYPTPYAVSGNFYTTDPRLVDSDFDIIQDGTEVMVVTGIPAGPPGTFGTNLGVFVPDADASIAGAPTTFTNPYDGDTDNDGLPDGSPGGEDLPTVGTPVGVFGDGMIAGDGGPPGPGTWGVWDPPDPGWTETDPNDIDTDEDGLVDSWERNWAQTDPWTLDTDVDALGDGQEWHTATRPTAPSVPGTLPPQLWGVWNPNVGNGANGGFTFMADGDIASMTDPNWVNTDFEGFMDGGEDVNTNGVWDWTPIGAGNPYVWPGATGETNPCDFDSDHGGVFDGADGSPLIPRRPDGALDPPSEASLPNGDDSYQIIPYTAPFPAGADTTLRVGRDTMFIDPVPGDSGTGMFTIANNGPVNLDDIYGTVTDLDWVTDVPTYTAPSWADTLIIPYDSIYIWGVDEGVKIGPFPVPAPIITSTGPPPADGLPIGDLDDEVWVRVHIPWGQIPGVYEGRLVLWQGNPFFNNPIDTIVFQVEVDPVWEADILNNDSLPNGVGFSDPDSTGAFDNEMHLAAPLSASPADTLIGIFYKSNPNTEPDVDANYVNDVNGLDALPRYARPPWGPGGTPSAFYQDEWDTLDLYTNPDLQGNTRLDSVYMTYQFIGYSGPGFVTADSVEPRIFLNHEGNQDTLILIDTIDLGEWDSVLVKIYPYCLPAGEYYGWVYMWKDFDGDAEYNGPGGMLTTEGGTYPFVADNATPQEAEAFDAFILKFTVTAPDIDIVQDEMNIDADNFMTLGAMPGDSVWGIFTVTNPDFIQNFAADPWDGPTTEDADSVGVYDPDLAVLHPLPDSIWLYRIYYPQDSIKAYVYGPTTLDMGEWDATFSVRVNVPVGTPYGTYTTAYDSLNPVTADANDDFFGKILISATGLWSDAHYISIEPKSYQLLDWFDVRVNVGPTESIVVEPDVEVDSVDHGAFVIDSFSVINTGNADLYGIIFEPTSLQDGAGHIIHPDNVLFEPPQITELLMGDTAVVTKKIIAPAGIYTGWYTGEITVKDDDAFPSAVILCSLYVRPDYDLDISDNEQNLIGNIMVLPGDTGSVVGGTFLLVNPNSEAMNVDPDPFGNADLAGLTYVATDLTFDSYTIPSTAVSFSSNPASLASGASANVVVSVAIPGGQQMGVYTGMVTVMSVDGSADNFTLMVPVGSAESITLTGTLDKTVDHGVTAIDTFTVTNDGNADIDNIVFEVTDLADGTGRYIESSNISFDPTSIGVLAMGASEDVSVLVAVPLGTYATTYTGTVIVKDDDGYPMESIPISITVLPSYDIDIANNGGNVFGNVLGLSGEMGDVVSGEFDVYNPNSEAQNVDPDPFGNADLNNISYTVTDLEHQDNPLYSIPASAVVFSGPAVLPSGEGETASLSVNIPSDQEDGMYVGTVTAFDVVAGVSDEFELRVQVGAEESIDIVESLTSGSGDHNTEVTLTSFTIENTGNADLYNLLFYTSGLESGTYFLSPNDIYLYVTNFWAPVNDAVLDELLIGQSATAQPKVIVRAGQHAGTYTGFMRVMDDDGVPSDAIAVSLEVLSSYDIDIANNGGNVIGDYLTLEGGEGDVLSGEFDVYNPNSDAQNVDPADPFGNDDLVDITYTATNLQNQGNPVAFIDVSCVSFSAPLSLLSGESGTGTVTVAVPTGQEEGTYVGTVTATDASGVTDDFTIVVIIGASLDVDIVEDETSGSGGLAGLDDLVALPQFTVVNPTDAYNPDPDGPSNGDLYDLGFTASALYDGHEHLINTDNLYVRTTNYTDPTPISGASIDYLPLGEQAWVEPWILVEAGQHAGTYLGTMGVIGEQGYPSDVLMVRVVIPSYFDIDIANNAGDVLGNEMALGGNATETVTGHFDIYNPASDEDNVDADPFGNDDLGNITYSVTDLGHTENAFAWIMASDITITGPDALLSGESAVAEVSVNIPSDAISGAYIGTLTVTDDDAGVTDEFTLVVQVGAFEDVDIVEDMTQGTGDHGSSVELSSFTVVNPDEAYNPDPDGPGNTPLYNLRFRVTDLGDGAGHTIDAARIKIAATGFFGPTPVDQAGIDVLEVGQSATVIPTVDVESGQYAGTYTGMLEVYDDDGFPSDVIGVEVTVEPDYDLDISDNEQNLTGNAMTFANVEMGDALEGYFRLVNPANEDQNVDPDPFGNTDLTDLDWTATDLVFQVPPKKGGIKEADKIDDVIPSSAVTVSLPSTLEHGGAENVLVTINVPTNILAGTYKGSITVEDGVGDVSDFFYVEVFVRSVARIDVVEDTITGVVGDHGSLSATSFNVTNIGNVKLTGINFTSTNLYDGLGHTIPNAGITFDPENMPELAPEESTDVEVTVIIPLGTYGGTYEGTITAKNGAGSVSDEVTIRVTVNPSIDIVEDAITSTGEHGTLFATSFNVTNDGDIKLAGIEFTSTDLYDGLGHMISSDGITIAPENIPEFVPGATELVDVTVDVPLGTYAGTYEGTITAKDGNSSVSDEVAIRVTVNPDYDLDIVRSLISLGAGDMGETLDGQFRIINPNSEATNVDPDPFGNADLDELSYRATDLAFAGEPAKMGRNGITEYRETIGFDKGGKIGDVIPAENVSVDLPSFIASGGGEDVPISVVLPLDVAAGTYEGRVTVTGNGGVSDDIMVRVMVNETEDLDIAEASVEIDKAVEQGTTQATPDFTIVNTDAANNPDADDGPGNTTLNGIHFVADNLFNADGTRFISKDNIDFEPDNISSLTSGASATAHAVIHVPVGTYATSYSGLATALNDKGSVSDTVRLILTVAPSPYFCVADNEGNLVENTMYVVGDVGTTTPASQFVLKNPLGVGNVDITGITHDVKGLSDFTIGFDQHAYDVAYGGYTVGALTVTIPEDEHEGVYTGWVVFEYTGGDKDGIVSDSFNLNITVRPNEVVALTVDTLRITGREGTTATGMFSVLNKGNATLTDLELVMLTDLDDGAGTVLPRDRVEFTHPLIDTLTVGGTERIDMSINIPRFTLDNAYTGEFEVRDKKDGDPSYKAVVVLTVTSGTELIVDENPVTGGRVNIRCKADAGSEPELTILNLAGEIIRFGESFPKTKAATAVRVYEWLLDNESGKKVAPGMYIVLVKTTINGEEKVLKEKVLVIR